MDARTRLNVTSHVHRLSCFYRRRKVGICFGRTVVFIIYPWIRNVALRSWSVRPPACPPACTYARTQQLDSNRTDFSLNNTTDN